MKLKKVISLLLCASMLFVMVVSLASCESVETFPTEALTDPESESSTKKPYVKQTGAPRDEDMEKYDLKKFDLEKFLYPIWKTDVSYAEASFVRQAEDGVVEPLQLLYPIEKIISVRSADLSTLYMEGRDYEVTADGRLEILPEGKIPVLAYKDYCFDFDGDRDSAAPSLAGGKPHCVAGKPGKGFIYGEITEKNGGMSQWVISVTYKHSAESVITTPDDKSQQFQKFINKLEAGEDVTIVSIGDSITEGWSSSKRKGNKAPYCPPYNELFSDYVKSKYPDSKVTFLNKGISGSTTRTGICDNKNPLSYNGQNPKLLDPICEKNPDILTIAYGMNDGGGTPPDVYCNNIENIIKYVTERCPDICIVVVGTTLPNAEYSWSSGGASILNYHDDYPIALSYKEIEWKEAGYKVAVADVTTLNIELYQRKVYQDVTGSNSNHPNDYMHRIYAQVIIQTVFGGTE